MTVPPDFVASRLGDAENVSHHRLAFEPDLSRKLTSAGPVLHPSDDFLLLSQEVHRGGGGSGGGGAAEALSVPSAATLCLWLVRFPPAVFVVLALTPRCGSSKVVAGAESKSPRCSVYVGAKKKQGTTALKGLPAQLN